MPQGEDVVQPGPLLVPIVTAKLVGCGPVEPPELPPRMTLEQLAIIIADNRTKKHPNHFNRTEFLSVS